MATIPQAILTTDSTPHAAPDTTDPDRTVVFRGDGEPKTARGMLAQLAAWEHTTGILPDDFSRGGTVAHLEQRFAAMLGKEAAVFLPTGTLANHLAIRRLCAGKPRAVLQEQSHLYQDTGDCVPQLSGINLIPLACHRPFFTLDELQEALHLAVSGRVLNPVGAVMLETPVRRQHGQIVPYPTLVAITDFCRSQGIPTHLDGARLYMMSAATGISPQQYAVHFDTVYVSLYKYFGAPFGAILAGAETYLHDLYHERRMFGGGLPSASLAAALALQGAETFVERFDKAMRQGLALIEQLTTLPGIRVERFSHGSNIFPLVLASDIAIAPFLDTLRQQQVLLYPGEGSDSRLYLTVNTTILRQSNATLMAAFASALHAAARHANSPLTQTNSSLELPGSTPMTR